MPTELVHLKFNRHPLERLLTLCCSSGEIQAEFVAQSCVMSGAVITVGPCTWVGVRTPTRCVAATTTTGSVQKHSRLRL
jgi:hypothetical protein